MSSVPAPSETLSRGVLRPDVVQQRRRGARGDRPADWRWPERRRAAGHQSTSVAIMSDRPARPPRSLPGGGLVFLRLRSTGARISAQARRAPAWGPVGQDAWVGGLAAGTVYHGAAPRSCTPV